MAATPESKVKKECVKLLQQYHAYYFFPVTSGYGRSGVADIVVCFRGCYLAIECKAGKGTLTKLQEIELAKVRAAGGETLVINEHNIIQLLDWLQRKSRGSTDRHD